MIQSRELGFVPPRPNGDPELLVETARPGASLARAFQAWLSLGHWIDRFLRGERRHSGTGSVAFHSKSVHIVRDPVRELGERGKQEFDLAYADITRLEFVPPETVVVGFGTVTHGLNQQIALSLNSIEAHDAFDAIVEHMEARDTGDLYSVLDDGVLTHSREWTWEERLPDLGLTEEVMVELVGVGRTWKWRLLVDRGEDREGDEYQVVEDHGLVLTRAEEPDRCLLQAFSSQVLDGTGMALTLVERPKHGVGVRTSRDECFWIADNGDVRCGDEVIGSYPREALAAAAPDPMPTVFGTAPGAQQPVIVEEQRAPKAIQFERALPVGWVLALALVSLLPPPPPDR